MALGSGSIMVNLLAHSGEKGVNIDPSSSPNSHTTKRICDASQISRITLLGAHSLRGQKTTSHNDVNNDVNDVFGKEFVCKSRRGKKMDGY